VQHGTGEGLADDVRRVAVDNRKAWELGMEITRVSGKRRRHEGWDEEKKGCLGEDGQRKREVDAQEKMTGQSKFLEAKL
jgi:hypothetical protein